jgi:hypothetical protein
MPTLHEQTLRLQRLRELLLNPCGLRAPDVLQM